MNQHEIFKCINFFTNFETKEDSKLFYALNTLHYRMVKLCTSLGVSIHVGNISNYGIYIYSKLVNSVV